MKKELFAAAVLALLAGIAVWNLNYSGQLTNQLIQTIEASLEMVQNEHWPEAERLAEAAVDKWNSADSYIHIFVCHTEADLATDAFGDYLGELYRRDAGGARGAYQRLIEHISAIYELERITLKSVL